MCATAYERAMLTIAMMTMTATVVFNTLPANLVLSNV
jgi:hypothetical protein